MSLDRLQSVPPPNESFPLIEEQTARLYLEDQTVEVRGRAKMKMLPRPQVEFHVACDRVLSRGLSAEYELEFPGRTDRLELTCTNRTISNDGTQMTLQARRHPFPVRLDGPVQEVFFYLLNFFELRGIGFPETPLEASEWEVAFRPVSDAETTYETLKEKGGYGFTHVGGIRKKYQSSYSVDEARSIREALHFFFSFAAGSWTPLVFPVGLDNSDKTAWEEWGVGKNQTFGTAGLTWLDKHTGEALVDVFPGFYTKWVDSDWQKTLNDVIYWYVTANNQTQGTDTGLILAQAALELLAWTKLTQVQQVRSEKNFQAKPAYQNLRTILKEAGIPRKIPSSLPNLRNLASTLRTQYPDSGQTIDGPKIFTELRNNFVHPKKGRIDQHEQGRVIYEGFTLGLWYIELLLLHLFDYHGEYANRCAEEHWVGQTESVPWA